MNEFRFEAEIALDDTAPAEVVRERVYGGVTVTAEWPRETALPVLRLPLIVRGELESRDAPAYVELFFHDVYLLLNLASPGSFGGTIATTGGDYRVRELTFDAHIFAHAAPLSRLPLPDVIRWYDGLRLGTQQIATDGVATALFQLLHLARAPEREEDSILRLSIASQALLGSSEVPPRLLALRDEIAHDRAPVFHPMHDDALDPRVEDATREWIEVADVAAHLLIDALQRRVKGG